MQEKLLQLVRIFSNDIGMKRGIEKSAVLVRRDYTTSGNYNKSNGRKSKTGKNTYDKANTWAVSLVRYAGG